MSKILIKESQLRQLIKESLKKTIKEDVDVPKYIVRKVFATSEEDIYSEGATGKYGSSWTEDIKVTGNSLQEIINKVKEAVYVKDNGSVYIDEDGGVSFNTMGDEDNNEAFKEDIDLWKKGKKRLWIVDYYFTVEYYPKQVGQKTFEEEGVKFEY